VTNKKPDTGKHQSILTVDTSLLYILTVGSRTLISLAVKSTAFMKDRRIW